MSFKNFTIDWLFPINGNVDLITQHLPESFSVPVKRHKPHQSLNDNFYKPKSRISFYSEHQYYLIIGRVTFTDYSLIMPLEANYA